MVKSMESQMQALATLWFIGVGCKGLKDYQHAFSFVM